MKHISLSIYDHDYLKVCDVYDNDAQSQGQAYDIVFTEQLKTGWKEISFNLPYMVDNEENFRWDFIRNEYQLRLRMDDEEDWFLLQTPNKKKNGKSITNAVKCGHVAAMLKTKNLYLLFDDTNGIGKIDYLITRALTNTTWTLGECDTFYERDGVTEKVRSISSDGKKGSYQLIQDICNLFNAYPVFHGATRTVDIHALDDRLPLTEMYVGKNLNSLTTEINSSSIVTRLYVEGEYADSGYVGIDDYNNGLPFLMNFDYYRQVGLFRAQHEEALEQYIHDVTIVKGQIKDLMAGMLEAEDGLNVLWGQIPYVLLCLSNGRITKTYYGGSILEDQKEIVEGDELLIMPAVGDYRAYTVPLGGAVFQATDIYAVKFIVLPNGKVGARQVAQEAGIGDLEYKADDGLTLDAAMREALAYAEEIGDMTEELNEQNDMQTEIEGTFANAMGDMLRDGYWSNTNYAIGQEQLLYWDALDQMTSVSKPKVKYNISLAVISDELGYDKDEFKLNTKIHLLDEEMRINDIVYVSKRTLCLDEPRKDKIDISNDGLVSTVDSFEYVLGRMTHLADVIDQNSNVYDRAKVISSSGQVSTPALQDNSVTIQKLSPDVQNIINSSSFAKYRYGHSLQKPFNFSGSVAAFFGDDTIYGTTSSASLMGYTANNWVSLFCNRVSITYENLGSSGEQITSTISKVSNYSSSTSPNYVFVGIGQSDWLAGRTVGTNGDGSSTTFYGCMASLCGQIQMRFPNATVIFITPINQSIVSQNTLANLNDYRNAIFEVAATYGYNIVDGTKLGFPETSGPFRSQMIPNGKYPSEQGYAMMYRSMCGILL